MFEIKKDKYGFDCAEVAGTDLTASVGIFEKNDKVHARMYIKKNGKPIWSEDVNLEVDTKDWDELKVEPRLGPQADFYNVDIFTERGLKRILQFVFLEKNKSIIARVWDNCGEKVEDFGTAA